MDFLVVQSVTAEAVLEILLAVSVMYTLGES
jgi:hypothetical protein